MKQVIRPHNDQPGGAPETELVRVENLQVHFPLRQKKAGLIRAVDGVNFTLSSGETLALVGASGCGKTTVARALALLEQPVAGRIFFRGKALNALRGYQQRQMRRRIQMVFSNPYTAFPPRTTVREIIFEALGQRGPEQRLIELMARVGLNFYLVLRYPRDLSGSNRQRLALARALAVEPSLLICDQPTQYLEPAVGDAIVALLQRLNQELGLTMLLTARRLETARHADRVAIMIAGRIVEMGYYADLVRQPLHPFTQRLLQSSPHDLVPVDQELDPLQPSPGCPYAPVCPLVEARCHASFPTFVEGAPDHGVACHLR